ncbi:hypothetical protein [Haloarchaeobius baliensis]|uniref:hypothetical protein n=1 Tax=Haloarchaeobius baliensis TaxID=1670458 RepID=UPI003F8822E5
MDSTIQTVGPDALADAVESDEVTLVLCPPGIEPVRRLRSLGRVVRGLPETAASDDELLVVQEFVDAVFDLVDGSVTSYCSEYGDRSLFARTGGTVLVTRPRSFDWLCRSELGVSGEFVEAVDRVLLVRTPPTDAMAAIDGVRQRTSRRGAGGLRDDEQAAVLERARYPPYHFETPALQRHLGWYDATVTPEVFLPLSKHDPEPVMFPEDAGRALGELDVSVGPLGEPFADAVSRLVPGGGLPSRLPNERSPPVLVAAALVAVGLSEEADWLDTLAGLRTLPTAAERLEIALELPPGTVDRLTVFAADPARTLFRDRLADEPGDQAGESVLDVARGVVDEPADALRSVGSSLETMSTDPDAYGSSPLVGAWHWEGPRALHDAAAERELPTPLPESDGDDEGGSDWRSLVEETDLLEALDGGLVVLSGPRGSGKRRVAAALATELENWGATVRLPSLTTPDHVRTGIEATPDAVVVAAYGAEPARIPGDDGLRALPEWVDEGVCSGALLICDDTDRERLDEISERAGCGELAAWVDRVEISMEDAYDSPEREPAAVAGDLLDAVGWGEVASPSRRTVDVERVTDQSTLAAVAGVPDHALDGTFVGHVVAEVVDVVATTHGPDAARPWLSFVDDLVADVGRNRGPGSDDALQYRGEVYATAVAAVATADPTTAEWVHAVARGALEVTNETATPHGVASVGGQLEPFASAFAGALATLAQPPDGATVNHGAVGCVDQVLHEVVPEDGWRFPLHLVYGRAVGRIVRRTADPAAANGGLSTVLSLVQQHAQSPHTHLATDVLGNSLASMLGAVAGVECPPEDLAAWVTDIESRAVDAAGLVGDPSDRSLLLERFYADGIGLWVFEHDCPDDQLGPWLDAVGQRMNRTATTAASDDADAFVSAVYGHAVRTVVETGELDRAERLFAAGHRLVDAVAGADHVEDEPELRATLHAAALAAFADVEHARPDAVGRYPYGSDTVPSPDALGFEDWMERYDATVLGREAADRPIAARTGSLAAVYRGALSTHVQGFDADSDGTADGVTPRNERTWYAGLTELVEARAAESVDDPVPFLADVFGGAAVRWAADGESSRTREWLEVLVQSLRASRETIDGPDRGDWFDAFATTDAEVLLAVLTRTDVGERTHDRIVEAVLSQVELAANAPDNPAHPVVYVSSVFGTALALAADIEPAAVRFGVTEVLGVLEEGGSLDSVDSDPATVYERVFAEALATVGRRNVDDPAVDEWLDIVHTGLETTATREVPDGPAAFVADVFVRAVAEAAQDGADGWCRRLDAELREFARGPLVDDPATFLEGVYADVVVAGARSPGPRTLTESCIDAVDESVQAAVDADLLGADGAHERTFSRAAERLSAAPPRARVDHVARLEQGLRATGNGDIASAIFDAEGVDQPDGPRVEQDSTSDGRSGIDRPGDGDR